MIREAESVIRRQSHGVEGDTCFHCRKQGHWARDCPNKSPGGKTPPVCSSNFPVVQCSCGAGACVVRTSNTLRNPGRKFYSCPATRGENCNFFKWCDMVTDYEISKSPQFSRSPLSPLPSPIQIPMCSCGAGTCGVSVEQVGANAGRRCFICPVKKGQGACNFFQWEDDQVNDKVNDIDKQKQCSTEQSIRINQEDTETGMSCSPKEVTSSFQHLERMEDSSVKEDFCPSNPKAALGTSKEQKISLCENGGHNKTSKFLSIKLHKAADFTSVEDLVHQILRFHVLGWLGRLAFPPARCLTVPPSKPLFCCVFPSHDPIFIPREVKRDVECLTDQSQSPSDPLQLPPAQNAQMVDVLLEPSSLKSAPIITGGNAVISRPILEAFQQAALHIQNGLISLLESMDPLDHGPMVREANSAFAGLDCLGIDYRPFYERVKKFITCSSTLARIESTICNDLTSRQMIDSYHCKMSHYENISRAHSKAMTAFTFSDNRLHFLQKEATRVRKMLLQIETQLSCCDVETAVLEVYLNQISQDMRESMQDLEVVYKEASQAIQLQQQREEERSIAKEAMESARVQLRQ